MTEKRTIDISTKIILKIVIVILSLWFLFIIRDIIMLTIVALILAAALDPLVNAMEKKRIPRPLGITIVYLLLFIVIGGLFSFLIPPLIYQFKELILNFPQYLNHLTEQIYILRDYLHNQGINLELEQIFSQLGSGINYSSRNIFSTTMGFFSGFISMVAIFSLSFYMLAKKNGMDNFLRAIIPEIYADKVVAVAYKIKNKIGWWMLGQLSIMLIIFLMDYLVLYLLKMPYALTLAIIGGAFEIIPYAGPIISTTLATVVGFFVSPLIGIIILIAYIIIQQIENHVIVPQIMKKAVGLDPAIVILVILIGAKLAGIPGAILAIPLATALSVIIKETLKSKENE